MKKLQLLLVGCLMATVVAIAQDVPVITLGDIKLSDGRTYRNATLMSDAPTRLTIRHADGIAQIDKSKLPEALLAKYPIDLSAQQQAERDLQQRTAKAAEQREKDYKRIEAETQARRETARVNEAAATSQTQQAAKTQNSAEQRVQRAVENYFRTTWRPGNNAVTITDMVITLDSVAPKQGWAGQYSFEGEAYVEYYMSSGRAFTSNRMRFTGDMDERGKCAITTR